jgi:CRP-like cAMP-binding protein
LVLIDDVVVAVAAAVTTATLVVLFALLAKYRALVQETNRSNQLAKDLWDAMNQRLITQDTRIVDLMAKFEVASLRKGGMPTTTPKSPPAPVFQQERAPEQPVSRPPQRSFVTSQPISQPSQPVRSVTERSAPATSRGEATEVTILRALLPGPRTSIDILAVSGVTREHNARLLKSLWSRGLVARNDQNKPYVYEITEAGRTYLGGAA